MDRFLDIHYITRISRSISEFRLKVAKWGNSLAVRLPAGLVQALELREGDDVEIDVAGRRRLDINRKADVRALLVRLRKYRGRIPADFKFDRIEANERG